MEITKREVLASVSIVAVMLLIGFLISGKIQNVIMDDNERYNKAVKIEDEELYNMHTETYITTDDKGNAQVNTRTYWSWDYAGSEDMRCQEISFCGVNFASNKIDLPDADHIATIKESSNERYKYYGVGAECKGTIFTDLRDKTIPNNTSFYNNLTIDETIERLESDFPIIIFWIFWVVLIGGMVFGFYYLDNEWLK